MYPASEAIKIDLLGRREAKEGATFVREPNFVARNIPHPHPEFGSACGELHALLCFAQVNLAFLQPPREPWSSGAEIEPHESHERESQHPYGHMYPAQECFVLAYRPGMHHR